MKNGRESGLAGVSKWLKFESIPGVCRTDMKKLLGLVIAIAAVIVGLLLWSSVAARIKVDRAASKVDRAASEFDPAKLEMNLAATGLVHFTTLPDQVQTGIVNLPDGDKVKFWFTSHHQPPGTSYTRFDFSDGSRKYFTGYFCCEVLLPEDSIRSKQDLLAFIGKHDGMKP